MTEIGAEKALKRAADFIPQGLAVFDAGLRLVTSNQRYHQLLDLPPQLVRPGTALYDIALYLGQRGDLGAGVPEELAVQRVRSLSEPAESVSQRRGDDGRVLECLARRMPMAD